MCRNLQYIERDGNEYLFTLQSYPDWLQKKITLLKYFRDYMTQHLLKVSVSLSTTQVLIEITFHICNIRSLLQINLNLKFLYKALKKIVKQFLNYIQT